VVLLLRAEGGEEESQFGLHVRGSMVSTWDISSFPLACLVSRDSELANLVRSLIKLSPPPPPPPPPLRVYGSPTLGKTRDSVHVPTSVWSPICK
jgi:hypothetical protein